MASSILTFYPVYEFTKQVAGDEANVESGLVQKSRMVMSLQLRQLRLFRMRMRFVYENEEHETWVPELLKTFKK